MSHTVVQNVLLFDGERTIHEATVVFDGHSGLITSVSSAPVSSDSYPSGATIIDGTDHTLIPGLIDAHVHSYGLHLPPGSNVADNLKGPLRAGVTTVCDMHSDSENIWDHQKRVDDELEAARKNGRAGRVTLSSLKSAHLGATIDGGWPVPIVMANHPTDELKAKIAKWPKLTAENASDFVANHKKRGANYIKLMQENCCSLAFPTDSIPVASLELQTAVVDAAHKQGLIALGHATAIESTEIILKAGADGLAHTFIDQAPTDEIISLHKQKNAFVVPTLVVLTSLTGEEQSWRERFADIASSRGLLTDVQRENLLKSINAPAQGASVEHAYEAIKRLKAEGVDIVAGTDSCEGLQGTAMGPSLWQELSMYVEKCGFSVEEALRSATEVSARRFGFRDRGIVQEGKRADLVLVKGDLLKSLDCLWKEEGIVKVWREGCLAAA